MTSSKCAPHLLLASLLLALFLLSSGCSSGGSSGRARPSLTDAAEQAKKEPEDQEVVRPTKKKEDATKRETEQDDSDDDTIVTHEPQLTTTETAVATGTAVVVDMAEPEPKKPGWFRAGAFVAGGGFYQGPLQSYRSVGAFVGGRRGRWSADVRAAGFVPHLRSTSGLDDAIKDEFGMTIEGLGRYHFTPHHTFMDVGVAAALRFGFFDWGWENPITVDDGDGDVRTYDSDTIGFFSLLGGVAFTPARWGKFMLGTTLLGGGQVYTENTLNGFRDTLFEDSWMLEISVDLAFSTADMDPVIID